MQIENRQNINFSFFYGFGYLFKLNKSYLIHAKFKSAPVLYTG